jgi:hypothetical protein
LSFLHSEPPTPNLAPPSHRTAPPSATSAGPIRVDTPGADQGQNRWAEKKGLVPFSFQRIFSSILIKFKSWKYFAIHIYIHILFPHFAGTPKHKIFYGVFKLFEN